MEEEIASCKFDYCMRGYHMYIKYGSLILTIFWFLGKKMEIFTISMLFAAAIYEEGNWLERGPHGSGRGWSSFLK